MPLLPIPVRHTRHITYDRYAKKLGAFIHFFVCMHISINRGEQREKARETARTRQHTQSGKKQNINKTHIYVLYITRMKLGERRAWGKGPARHPSIHRASFDNVHILRKQSPKYRFNEGRRHNHESDERGKGEKGENRGERSSARDLSKILPRLNVWPAGSYGSLVAYLS